MDSVFRNYPQFIGRNIMSEIDVPFSHFTDEDFEKIGKAHQTGIAITIGKVGNKWCIKDTKRMKRLEKATFKAKGYNDLFRAYYVIEDGKITALFKRKYVGMTIEEAQHKIKYTLSVGKNITKCNLFASFKVSRPAHRGRGQHCNIAEKITYEKKFLKL